jgi:hypothetical protein
MKDEREKWMTMVRWINVIVSAIAVVVSLIALLR